MHTPRPRPLARAFSTIAAASLLAACADLEPTAPISESTPRPSLAKAESAEYPTTIATRRRATARYHDLNVAIGDGFFELHPCESLPGEGPVGILYVHLGRLADGVVDPAAPDALLYEPSTSGQPRLVGVEFAVFDVGQAAPELLGATFQREAEFGVFALHAWVWRHNPEGMFAETNPRVSCGEE
jgi:hypothetical protein